MAFMTSVRNGRGAVILKYTPKDTNLGVAKAFFFNPNRNHFKTYLNKKGFSDATLNENFAAKYNGVLHEIDTDDKHQRPFPLPVPPPPLQTIRRPFLDF